MKKETGNIKFNYMYCDSANYKNHGSMIFPNPNGVSHLPELEELLRATLIDGEFFEAEMVSIPPLYFKEWDPELDHSWHYFDSFELTDKPSTDERSIDAFLKEMMRGIDNQERFRS